MQSFFICYSVYLCWKFKIFPAEAHSDGNGLFRGYFGSSLLSFFCYRTIVNIVRGLVLYLDRSLPGFIRKGEVECKKNLTASVLKSVPPLPIRRVCSLSRAPTQGGTIPVAQKKKTFVLW